MMTAAFLKPYNKGEAAAWIMSDDTIALHVNRRKSDGLSPDAFRDLVISHHQHCHGVNLLRLARLRKK
jgi:hypothetical protein